MKKIKTPSKAQFFSAVVVLIIIACAGFWYVHKKNTDLAINAQNPDSVNLEPATAEEKKQAESTKETIVKRDEERAKQQSQQTTGQNVKPTITYAEQYGDHIEVGGFVGGIFEEGGKCTADLIKNGKTVSGSSTAITNVNSTSCPTIMIPVSNLTEKGSWTVTLTYQSASNSGVSSPQQVEVK